MKVLIIGGVAGGATAAARLRRMSEEVEIILFERGKYVSFANCGLPYYIGGIIPERDHLLVQTKEGLSRRFNIDIRTQQEALKIDPIKKTVKVKDLLTDEIYEESYDKLLLSPGAKPIFPKIPGVEESKNIFTLRNMADIDKIKAFINKEKPKKALVVGGGFIGLEMAENLARQGMEVTIAEMADQVMAPLDFEMASIIHNHLLEKGVRLYLKNGVQSFTDEGKGAILPDGTKIETDLTILSIGVKPENDLAITAGLELGDRGGIAVNEFLETSKKDIYAIGDAVEVTDYMNGFKTMIPLAGPANRQGRIVADNILGERKKYGGTLGTSVVKVFELTAATTGNNEKTLQRLGITYESVHIHPNSHAGYYPGAEPLSLKLIFDKQSGKIFGAQAVGKEGSDKRIDVIAAAIKGNLTVEDLTDLELAYAPPFSSAKDPVNMAGYVASNILNGDLEQVQWNEIGQLVAEGGLLIDVRDESERKFGFIPGSVHIPLDDIRDKLSELPKHVPVYTVCQVGLRGYIASRILKNNGFQAKNLSGGWKTYASVYDKESKVHNSGEVYINERGEAVLREI